MSDQAGAVDRLREVLGQAAEAVTPRTDGLERIPAHGPAVIAFNHVAPLDLLLARLVDNRRIHFVASRPATAGLRGWLSRRSAGNRTPSDLEELAQARRVLEAGHLLGVFPEGPRSPDGRLYRGETLVARLALTFDVPVIPVAVVPEGGVSRALAPRVVVGEPVDLARFAGPCPDELTLRTATDAVMYALLELSGQQYLDVPSGRRRSDLADARRARHREQRERAAQRRADEQARIEQRRADRAAEAAELAEAQRRAAEAAREQARRAAQADEQRRRVKAARLPQPPDEGMTDLRRPTQHVPLEDEPPGTVGR